MNKTVSLLREDIQSSSTPTPEFKTFVRTFKKEFKQELETIGATNPVFTVGHFEISGFYTLKEQAYYFSLSDIRFFKEEKLLIRTAKGYKDYTGGSNRYVTLQKGMGVESLNV
jgi:hypothetical protein